MNIKTIKINQAFQKQLIAAGLLFGMTYFSAIPVYASEINSNNVLNQINEKRAESNLPKLKQNTDLSNAASLKAKDMINRSYFEHYAFGLAPWDFMKMSGYDYLYAGENLAMDFNTSEGIVNAWMSSPAHRANILDPEFTETGVGIIKGEYTENGITHETIMVDNMFGQKRPTILKIFDSISKNISLILGK